MAAVYGSDYERALVARRAFLDAQLQIRSCMLAGGFTYPDVRMPEPQRDSSVSIEFYWWGPTDVEIASERAYGVYTSEAPLAEPMVTDDGYFDLSASDRMSYDSQLARCSEPAFESQDQTFLAEADSLINDLDAFIKAGLERFAADGLRTYASCVSRSGYSFDRPSNIYSLELEAIGSSTNLFAMGEGDPAYGSALDAAISQERRIAVVDVGCRSEALPSLIDPIATLYDSWYERRASDISEVLASWSDYRES